MSGFKKILRINPCKLLCLLALLLCACAEVSDHCSDYNPYNPKTQFCFKGVAVDKCGGSREYDPETQDCCTNNGNVVPLGASCSVTNPTLFTLTVNAGANVSSVTPASPTTHNSGAMVNITATSGCPASQTATFGGWTPATGITSPSSASTTINMTANRTVTASFTCSGGSQCPPGQTPVDGTCYLNNHCMVQGCVTGTCNAATGQCDAGTNPNQAACQNAGGMWTGTTCNCPGTQQWNGSACVTGSGGGSCTSVGRTVKIGNLTWMAENLNCETADSWCYQDNPSNCAKYGRLYTWNAATSACPTGWRLPIREDWNDLVTAAGGNVAGRALKSKAPDWNGNDNYDFSALPGGVYVAGSFSGAGNNGYWWSATESGSVSWYWFMFWGSDNVDEGGSNKDSGFSVRCVAGD